MSQIPLKFVTNVGTANGLATLDGSGKIPSSQLPSTVLEYQGLWDPSTNTPVLQDLTGTNGFVYQVSVAFAGPIVGLSNATMVNFQVGNLVIYSGTLSQWEQAASLTGVTSVNGATGAVTINAINQLTGDVTTSAASGSQSKATSLVATSNSTLTTLSALSLPGSQVTGNIAGNAANITATSNSTLTTLTALSLPGTQVTGNIAGNAANITATSNSTLTTLSALSLPYSQITGAPAAITALTGDATATGPGSAALTLATVNANTGSFGSSSSVPVITVNGKGLITAVSTASVTASAAFHVTSQSTTYSAAANDYIIASGASFTITLPTAVGISGQIIVIKHSGTSLTQLYTLNTTSAQTIGGIASGSYALYTNGETLTLVSDGANWQIQDHKTDTGWINGGVTTLSATSAYVFTVTAANATVGAMYSNNSQTFTVTTTIAGGTTLTCSGTGTPGASGTLTKVSGTGDTTITFSSKTITGVPAKGSGQTSDTFWWRRSGNNVECRVEYSQTSSSGSAAGVGDYTFYLPTGITLDTTKFTPYTTVLGGPNALPIPTSSFGSGWAGAATQWGGGFSVVGYSSTQFRLFGFSFTSTLGTGNIGCVSASYFALNNATHGYGIVFVAPVSGWQP